MAARSKSKCDCGCGQAPAATTRLRKASCSCGASIIRLSRQSLATVNATCITCGDPLLPDCLYDRAVGHDESDARRAVASLEARADRASRRAAPKMFGAGPTKLRCSDCGAIRAPHGPCKACRSERDPTTTYMHPRAARAVGGDMPF